ncbi:hypothetical protein Ancab_008495 [Ancistrocladus abbreviatus]
MAEGQRISVEKACENPTCVEIGDCCSHLKLPFVIEIDKAYPRDFMQRGRVRVLLKREEGTLINPAISSRKQLMLRVQSWYHDTQEQPRSRRLHQHPIRHLQNLYGVARRRGRFLQQWQEEGVVSFGRCISFL